MSSLQHENFQDNSPGINTSVHGYHGELSVSAATYAQKPFQRDFLGACANIGIREVPDVMDLKTSNAVGVSAKERCSEIHIYIYFLANSFGSAGICGSTNRVP